LKLAVTPSPRISVQMSSSAAIGTQAFRAEDGFWLTFRGLPFTFVQLALLI